ncbi:dienelactone hydrolase [Streptacidiphilus sp. EB129]
MVRMFLLGGEGTTMVRLAERVEVRRGVRYGSGGLLLDVYRPAAREPGVGWPTVLLWHGRPAVSRTVLAALGRAAASQGLLVLAPDWRTDAADGGWGGLRESLAFARRNAAGLGGDPHRFVLAGWSVGGRAALAAALRPSALSTDGWRPSAVVGLGSNYRSADELMHPTVMDELAASVASPVPVWLHHGTRDVVVDVARSREFAAALEVCGWQVSLTESDSDHAGVVLAEYDRALGRCRGATADHAVQAGEVTARLLARAAFGD